MGLGIDGAKPPHAYGAKKGKNGGGPAYEMPAFTAELTAPFPPVVQKVLSYLLGISCPHYPEALAVTGLLSLSVVCLFYAQRPDFPGTAREAP